MDMFLGKEVTIVRAATATDNGFDASKGKQVVIRWVDGSEKTVLASQVTHKEPPKKRGEPLSKTSPPIAAPAEPQPEPVIQLKDRRAQYHGIDVLITRAAGQGDFTLGADDKHIAFNPALGPQVMIRVPPDGLEQCVLLRDCVIV